MTITTRDELINALGNNSSQVLITKNSLANMTSGGYGSLWRASGQPAQGAIPGAAAVCDETTLGGFPFAQQTPPATSYLGVLNIGSTNNAATFELHDRIAHMGGLSGTSTGAQTVGIDASALSGSNVADRMGAADYSELAWWLEWYTDTGATPVNATVNVTYDDNSTGNLTALALSATTRASRMFLLNTLNTSGKIIKAVNTVTLSASTGTVGSFGVTLTRFRAPYFSPIANSVGALGDWAALGLPELYNSSCIFIIMPGTSTTTGSVGGNAKIAHG